MIVRSPRVRPGKFVRLDAKRLLQQYRRAAAFQHVGDGNRETDHGEPSGSVDKLGLGRCRVAILTQPAAKVTAVDLAQWRDDLRSILNAYFCLRFLH